MHRLLLFQADFVNWGAEHQWWLAAAVASIVCWIFVGRQLTNELQQRRLALLMSLIPVAIWASVSVQLLQAPPPLRLDLILPFHICYFLNLLLPFMLWRKSYFLFEVSYFMVMAGCIQALLTPDIPQSFPHPFNIRYFFVHIGLAQSILFAVFVYGFRPTWRSFGKAFLWSNIYFVFVAGINLLLGTNFMYLCKKPPNPTLLDLFGEWPWYILGGELLAVVLFTVVLLPFLRITRPAPEQRRTGIS
ncbi:MAG: TIGR02206 family membrane protein [Lewinellaceae bacterium]|nr:TIGR02206 family membrane protein [Saprospiraceae bacterium]MCB9315681.1 TIGR02206 family membrane protein [Lewinellaceae bacterium]MCB9329983.1 TIGR02206 family membrane protein [Lewinellaceae bacterium]